MCTVENWSTRSRVVCTGWLLAWILVGAYLLFAHQPWVGAAYIGIWVLQYVHCRYLACTRCHYYGKRCYMLGGDCAKLLFAQRKPGKRMPDDALIGTWWAVVTLFPVPFFVVWKSWVYLGIYLAVSLGWHGIHHLLACKVCMNEHCPLNAAG
jgi:hypothetical protein